jgi:hypothetical protein
MGSDLYLVVHKNKATTSILLIILFTFFFASGCKSVIQRREDIRPRVLRDVPARVLAYRLEPDVNPPELNLDESEKLVAIQNDFMSRRTDDALLRTVVSPDGQRVLALYGNDAEPSSAFRIDLYNKDGQFIRNLVPPELSCVFPETVMWSPDSNFINFIAHKRVMSTPTPAPPGAVTSEIAPDASPTLAPNFAPVQSYQTEQIYICNRDGYDLKPLTTREGLIYFHFAWAPDNHAIVALACKEDEWTVREKQFKSPAGRPRLITPDGKERLLDDALAEALPVWSPDSSKVATAFEYDVAIYDAATDKPTQARLPLRDQLLSASVSYEQKVSAKTKETSNNTPAASPTPQTTAASSVPASFNPIVRFEWNSPDRLFFQTAFVRLMPAEAITTFQRWHVLNLSAQAAVLK